MRRLHKHRTCAVRACPFKIFTGNRSLPNLPQAREQSMQMELRQGATEPIQGVQFSIAVFQQALAFSG